MAAKILDGNELASLRRKQLKDCITEQVNSGHSQPGLAVILVGEDPASQIYVSHKRKGCEQVGIVSFVHQLSKNTSQEQLLKLIDQLNHDDSIHGILVQLPLPEHIDANTILEKIVPHKDIDGFHPYNLGRLAQRRPLLRPCTPWGIIIMLDHYQIPLKGEHVVVVSASNIVGRPMLLELLLKGSTVTVCHRFTQNLSYHVEQAKILISAIGKPNIIQSSWLAPGCVVVDVGTTRTQHGGLVGDIDFNSARQRASWITPVPGGVGPMTVTALLENTVMAAYQKSHDYCE